jgi:hypothetical protein
MLEGTVFTAQLNLLMTLDKFAFLVIISFLKNFLFKIFPGLLSGSNNPTAPANF